MNNILSFIPGFRSNTKWKKIIAIIYYAILVLMMFSEFFTALAGVALPFLIFGFSDLIRHKKKAIPLKNAFVGLSLALLVFIFSVGMAGPSENNDSPTGSGIVNHNEDKVIDKDDGQLATSAPDEKTDNENTNKTDDNSDSIIDVNNEQKNDESDSKKNDIENENKQNSNVSGKVVVHYIDVGQGDSILVQAPSFNMLIDGGNRDNSAVNYIKKQGISELDLVISTHPHSDHIGGLINVLEEINVKEVIDPAVVHTTKTFEDYLTLIDEKNIKFTEAKPGMKKDLGNGASLEILGPASASGSNLNDVSVVARLAFGNVSFLFAGDSETKVLNRLAKEDIKSDVLKVAHHGSHNGVTQEFIKAVSPKAAIISAGKDNGYGHPHNEALDILAANGVDIYRTDLQGTIVIESDGQIIDVNVKQPYQHIPPKVPEATVKPAGPDKDKSEPAAVPTKEPEPADKPTNKPAPQPTVKPDESQEKGKFIGSTESDKYHMPSCRYAKKILPNNEVWFETVDEAHSAGYKACGVCNPK